MKNDMRRKVRMNNGGFISSNVARIAEDRTMKRNILLTFALFLISFASTVQSAELAFSPGSLNLALTPGESKLFQVIASLNNPPQGAYNVSFVLQPMGGTMPPSWTSSSWTTIAETGPFVAIPISIRIPAGAAPGTYTSFLIPMIFWSSVALAPTSRPLPLNVTVFDHCSNPPTVAINDFGPSEFKAPNNKIEEVSFRGAVTLPAGCALKRVWYELKDEYVEYGRSEDLVAGPGGTFSHGVPIMVSRRGDDKDGRLYQLTIFAENEAGVGASGGLTVVIRHDQRKR